MDIDRTGFSGGLAVGVVNAGQKGFVTGVIDDFEAKFASGSTLYVYLGDKLIDQLSLEGTAAAVESMRRCNRIVSAELAEARRERERYAHLPEDPFAAARSAMSPAPTGGARQPIPKDPRRLATGVQINYPSSALRNEEQGNVGIRMTVSPSGLVTDCTVTSSSGSLALDEAACRSARRYGTFEPAIDASGNPVIGHYETTFRYSLPE